MRMSAIVLAGLTTLVAASGAATAQQTGPREQPPQLRAHIGGPVQARWIMDAPVRDQDGRVLGHVLRLWIDPSDGRVHSLVVSGGGTEGRPVVRRVIDWKDVDIGWSAQRMHLVVDRRTLDRAPEATESDLEEVPAASPAAGQEGPARPE